MSGSLDLFQELINIWKLKKAASPALITWKLRQILVVLEDTYSVSGDDEINEAIDNIGDGAGSIFIEAGTHILSEPIAVDGSGSVVIYGHGDNTILKPADGVSAFTVSDSVSLIIQNLKIDTSNYTGATSAISVNETGNNIVALEKVTIVGGGFGYGIEYQSNNGIIFNCNISGMSRGIFINSSNSHLINNNNITANADGIYLSSTTGTILDGNNIYSNILNGVYATGSSKNKIESNLIYSNDSNTANPQAGLYITTNSDENSIVHNNIYDNNNAGAGTGYGIYIGAATCNKNIVNNNTVTGNDVEWYDMGTYTDINYKVSTVSELEDAIVSIGASANDIGTIELLPADYVVSTTISLNGQIIDFIGNTYLGARLRGDTDGQPIFTVTGGIATFKNLFFYSDYSDDTPLVYFNAAGENSSFESCFFRGDETGTGISISNTGSIFIDKCDFNSTLHYGIKLDTSGSIFIDKSLFRADPGSTSHFNGIDGSAASSTTISNCIFSTWTDAGTSAGIYLDACYNSTITGNIFNSNKYGIYLINGCYNIDMTGNTITQSTTAAVYINGSNNNVITGNKISGGNGGIQSINSDNLTIGNNQIENLTNNWGIQLSGSDSCGIIGNSCNNNTVSIAGSSGGILIDSDSNLNNVSANICNGNLNAGAGDSYGILINNANCDDNYITNNLLNGNDIPLLDSGTNTRGLVKKVQFEGWESDSEVNCTVEQVYNAAEFELILDIAATGAAASVDIYAQFIIPSDFQAFLNIGTDITIRAIHDAGASVNGTITVNFLDASGTDSDDDSINATGLTGAWAAYDCAINAGSFAIGDKVIIKITLSLPDADDNIKIGVPIINYY